MISGGIFTLAQVGTSATPIQAGSAAVITGVLALVVPHVFREIQARREHREKMEESAVKDELQTLRSRVTKLTEEKDLLWSKMDVNSERIDSAEKGQAELRSLVKSGMLTGSGVGTTLPPRILLIEDDTILGRKLAKILRLHGADVLHVTMVKEAEKEIQENTYDSVILDLQLTDGESDEIANLAHKQSPPVDVIIITGTADQKRIDGLKPKAFFIKPFSLDALLKVLFPDPVLSP